MAVTDVSKTSEASGLSIKVYPNPYVKGRSSSEKISFGNLGGNALIKIYNTGGELVKELASGAENEVEWNIRGVRSGIYLYTVISSEGVKKGKISIIK